MRPRPSAPIVTEVYWPTLPVLSSVVRVARGAGGVRAVGHLEVAVGAVVVADEAEAVRADRDRGVRADVARAVERGEGGAGAGGVEQWATLRSPLVSS